MAGEAYSKRYAGGFVDLPAQTTSIDSQFLNGVETELLRLLGADPADASAQVWDAALGRFKTVKITAANISPVANIAKSQLAPLAITDADVAPGANISGSKIGNIPASQIAGYPSDGSKVLAGDGSWPTMASVPTGMMAPFAGASAPSGYLMCDGSIVSRTTYATLFAVIGTAYGAGDGSTNFGLPDLRGRVPVGKSTAGSSFPTLGQSGGEETHTLSVAELAYHGHGFTGNPMGAHHHNTSDPGHSHNMTQRNSGAGDFKTDNIIQGTGGGTTIVRNIDGQGGVNGVWCYEVTGGQYTSLSVVDAGAGTPTGSADPAGGNAGHNNVQPYQVANYIIKT